MIQKNIKAKRNYRSASGSSEPVSMFSVMWTESNVRVCGASDMSVLTDVLCSAGHRLTRCNAIIKQNTHTHTHRFKSSQVAFNKNKW